LADDEVPEESESSSEEDLPPGEAAEPLASEQAAERPQAGEGLSDEQMATVEAMMQSLRQAKVSELLLSTCSTLASVAYGKLEAGDLSEAKLAIDAIGAISALLRGHVDATMLRDFDQALAGLQLAYAQAADTKTDSAH